VWSPKLIPALIEWVWAADTLTVRMTFTPTMNDGLEPAEGDFVLKHGGTTLPVTSVTWETNKIVALEAALVGAPALPIGLKFTTPSANFISAAGQWVAKFEDQNVPETP